MSAMQQQQQQQRAVTQHGQHYQQQQAHVQHHIVGLDVRQLRQLSRDGLVSGCQRHIAAQFQREHMYEVVQSNLPLQKL
jgi:hypothetical protein